MITSLTILPDRGFFSSEELPLFLNRQYVDQNGNLFGLHGCDNGVAISRGRRVVWLASLSSSLTIHFPSHNKSRWKYADSIGQQSDVFTRTVTDGMKIPTHLIGRTLLGELVGATFAATVVFRQAAEGLQHDFDTIFVGAKPSILLPNLLRMNSQDLLEKSE